jgi:3-methyladenine DNA glycosylase AlkC
MKNNFLRMYISSYARFFRKKSATNLNDMINKTRDQVNIYVFDVHAKYNSLSEEERYMIEQIVEMLF